jgi:hypothetical protein
MLPLTRWRLLALLPVFVLPPAFVRAEPPGPATPADAGPSLSAAAQAVEGELRGLADRFDPASGKSDAVREQARADFVARLKGVLASANADEKSGAVAFLAAELPEIAASGALMKSEKPVKQAGFGEDQKPADLAGRARDVRRAALVATVVQGGLLAPVAQTEALLGARLLRGCANATEHGQLQPCMMRSLRTLAELQRFASEQFLPAWRALRPALGPLDALAKVDPGTRLLALVMLGADPREALGSEGLADGWTLLSDELTRPDACLKVLPGLGTRVLTAEAIIDANANFRPGSFEVHSRCPALGQAFDRAYFLPFWRAMGTPEEPALNETEESLARGVAVFNALGAWSSKFTCEELLDRVLPLAGADTWDPAPFLEASCKKPAPGAVAKVQSAEAALVSQKTASPSLRAADWWARMHGGVSELVLATLFTTLESWDARGLQRSPEALKALVDEMEKQNPPEGLPKAVLRAWDALPPKSRDLYVQQLWSRAQENPLQHAQSSPLEWRLFFKSSSSGPWADGFQQALVQNVTWEFQSGACELSHCGDCNAVFGDVMPELGHERWLKLRASLHSLDKDRRCTQSQWLQRFDARVAQLVRGWLDATVTGQAEAEAVSFSMGCADEPARAPLEGLLASAPFGNALAKKWVKSKMPCERLTAVRLLRSDAAANKAALQALARDKDATVSAMAKAALAAPPKKK